MEEFDRRLDAEMLRDLHNLANSGGNNWWKDLLAQTFTDILGKPQPLFVAFRNGYLNAYAEGQSILRIGWAAGTLRMSIHSKFVLDKDDPNAAGLNPNAYYTFDESVVRDNEGRQRAQYEGAATLARWVERARCFARPKTPHRQIGEKQGVAAIAARNRHVIDVEMALPPNPGCPNVADRIDLVALEDHGGAIHIVFYEAKHYENRHSLRAVDGAAPVHAQLRKYESWLCHPKRREQVIAATRRACRLHEEIRRMRVSPSAAHPLVSRAAVEGSGLKVNPRPRLIVIGPDAGQPGHWQPHKSKLLERLSAERLLSVPSFAPNLSKLDLRQACLEARLPTSARPDWRFEGEAMHEEGHSATPRDALLGLAGLAPALSDPTFRHGCWHPATEDESGVITLDYYSPSKAEETFVHMAYRLGLVRSFDWPSWMQLPAARRLVDSPDHLAAVSFGELWRLITSIIRGDRFNEGMLASAFERRVVLGICRRAEALLAEATE
ncbi:DUF6508 domain-containing protein [Roseomonas xinghualingensis]|uniref:DUF6508 domain-containing protein n=1 Tax=Roseomonas xinghualingensis TaxID=2986475 RepID=UPI0021F0EF63|nr:DUF6508 domain-containing protein [Roseomonas sp. SXEYE001]MCV4210347.1 DUF6508 domain-containing protein [Roseomonas sp. SXEYE001]